MLQEITVRTHHRSQLIDVTAEIREVVASSGVRNGTVVVFVPHTTAGVTINENADPSVCSDMLKGLDEIAPEGRSFYRHDEGNSDSHIKASLIGASETVIVDEGKLVLGVWQGIYFAEFDGPRSRSMYIKIQED